MKGRTIANFTRPFLVFAYALLILISTATTNIKAAHAACPPQDTSKGVFTQTISVASAGTYRVWSRIKAPDTTNNSYYLEIDGTTCGINFGDNAAIPASTWTWVDYQSGNIASKVDVALTAGPHTFTLIGREANVGVDRLLLLNPTDTCISNQPNGNGDNCTVTAPPNVPPSTSITSPANNATFTAPATINITANAADSDGTVSKVEFFQGTNKLGEDLTNPYSFSWTNIAAGTYSITSKATDNAGAVTTSSAVSVTVSGTPPPTACQNVTIPAYFYPPSYWAQATAGAPTVSHMILNPASGPGATKDPNYATVVSAAQAKGIKVLGYVATTYGVRDMNVVKAEIDQYKNFYNVKDIFLDETSSQAAQLTYYQSLATYIHGTAGSTVMLNPGTIPDEGYMNIGDIVTIFESDYNAYLAWQPPTWVNNYPASKYYHIVYANPDSATMANAVNLSRNRNAGNIYVTSDILPNPWDTLPSYFSEELVQASQSCSDTTAPSAPTGLTATATSSTQVNLTWNASTDNVAVTIYDVYRNNLIFANVTSNSYVDNTVTASITYSYSVKARDGANNQSPASSTVSVTTPALSDTQKPSAPANLTASPAATQINLAWTASTDNVGVTKYNVYRSTASTAAAVIAQPTGISYSDTSVTQGTTYTYYIRAVDAAGNISDNSNTVTSTIVTPPPASGLFTPTDDAYTRDNSSSNNYGANIKLLTCSDNCANTRVSWLKFTVSGLSTAPTSAKLRLYVNQSTGSAIKIANITDTTWKESTINWNNQPDYSIPTFGTISSKLGTWVEFDVASVVKGNGTYSFAITDSTTSVVGFDSKEGVNKPQLVIK